jgi:hypothetical protein
VSVDRFSEALLGPDPEPARQDQAVIAEVIIAMAEAIARFAQVYANADPLDLSPTEREQLRQVRARLDDVLDLFGPPGGTP